MLQLTYKDVWLDQQTITDMQAKGFTMTSARINYILHWTKEETGKEIKIVLPEIYFER